MTMQVKIKLRKLQEQEKNRAVNKFDKSVESGDMLVRVSEAEAEVFRVRNKMQAKEKQIRQLKQMIKTNTTQTDQTRQIMEHETGWVDRLDTER